MKRYMTGALLFMALTNGMLLHAKPIIIDSVAKQGIVDVNDGTHPIYDRNIKTGEYVARPGVYPYAYGPTVMFDHRDKLYKMWAGVGWNGDTISYKQADTLASMSQEKWDITLEPRRTEPVADQIHCCDPGVIYADGGYYLYYTGAGKSAQWPDGQGYIMVAFSKDGRKFALRNGGLPVVDMGKLYVPIIGYGVGQPSVTLGPNGWYYMLYTYSADNQYSNSTTNHLAVIRSKRANFDKWEPVATISRGEYACSNELVYHRAINTMLVVINDGNPAIGVRVRMAQFSLDFKTAYPEVELVSKVMPNSVFGEGIGILTDPQRRLMTVDPVGGKGAVTIFGATYAKRPDGMLEHIAGPTSYISWEGVMPALRKCVNP